MKFSNEWITALQSWPNYVHNFVNSIDISQEWQFMSTNVVDKLQKQWIFISQKSTPLRTNFTRAARIGKREFER